MKVCLEVHQLLLFDINLVAFSAACTIIRMLPTGNDNIIGSVNAAKMLSSHLLVLLWDVDVDVIAHFILSIVDSNIKLGPFKLKTFKLVFLI